MRASERQTWTVDELAERLGVNPSWVYRRCREGNLPHVQFSPRARILIPCKHFEAWLEAKALESLP